MSDAPDPQQLLMEHDVAQQRLAALQQRMEQAEASLMELRRAEATVESLAAGHALVPVGGGVHVHADLQEGRVVVPLGADHAAEMAPDAALESIRERATEAEGVLQRLAQDAQKTGATMQRLRATLEQMQDADDGSDPS